MRFGKCKNRNSLTSQPISMRESSLPATTFAQFFFELNLTSHLLVENCSCFGPKFKTQLVKRNSENQVADK